MMVSVWHFHWNTLCTCGHQLCHHVGLDSCSQAVIYFGKFGFDVCPCDHFIPTGKSLYALDPF